MLVVMVRKYYKFYKQLRLEFLKSLLKISKSSQKFFPTESGIRTNIKPLLTSLIFEPINESAYRYTG